MSRKENIDEDDVTYVRSAGNGACLFNSVAQNMHLDISIKISDRQPFTYKLNMKEIDKLSMDIRIKSVEWLKHNLDRPIPPTGLTIKDDIQDSIESGGLPNSVKTVNQYLEYMSNKSSYGGQSEICALSHVLNRNINVYKSNGNNYTTTGLGYIINENNRDNDIFLFHNVNEVGSKGGHHYDLLYPISRALIVGIQRYNKLDGPTPKTKSSSSSSLIPDESSSSSKKSSSKKSSSLIPDESSKPLDNKSSSQKSRSKSSSLIPDESSSVSVSASVSVSSSNKSSPSTKKSQSKTKSSSASRPSSSTKSSRSSSSKSNKSPRRSKRLSSSPLLISNNDVMDNLSSYSDMSSDTDESVQDDIILDKSKDKSNDKSKDKSNDKSKDKSKKKEIFSTSSSSSSHSDKLTNIKPKGKCDKYRMKSPPPGCNGVDGCKWIPKKGCFNDDGQISNQDTVKPVKSQVKTQKTTKPNKNPSKQKHKCRTFKKTKPAPGCEGNEECVWIPNIGCLENDEEVIKYEKEKKRN